MALRTMMILSNKAIVKSSTLLNLRLGNARGLKTLSLPDLPYGFGALEPVISREIMQLHHQGHHKTYVNNYNKALQQLDHAISNGDASTTVQLQSAIKFNGGGHINHSMFWKNLAPPTEGGGEPPTGSLGALIEKQFGSLESLVQRINAEGTALQGSGWVWLALEKDLNSLLVETTMNQDPLVTKGSTLVPLLGIDVWEHAYYLQYKNVSQEHLRNFSRLCKFLSFFFSLSLFFPLKGGLVDITNQQIR